MARWTHAMCDECWEAARPGEGAVRMARPRIEFCGWCAQRTESGIYTRVDPAEVPFPDRPADARCYVAQFRRFTLPGTDYVDTGRRRIWLDRMSDSDAIFVAGEFRRMETEAAMRAMKARGTPARRLRLS